MASAAIVGASQALALLAGISREGVAMVGGLFRGLINENAMRFSFLLSTPVIFAAGALKGVPRTAISLMAARRNTVSDNGIRRRLTSLSPAAANQLAATRHGRRPRRGEQRAGW